MSIDCSLYDKRNFRDIVSFLDFALIMETNEQSTIEADPENKVVDLFIEICNLNIFLRFFWNHMNIFELYLVNKFDRN